MSSSEREAGSLKCPRTVVDALLQREAAEADGGADSGDAVEEAGGHSGAGGGRIEGAACVFTPQTSPSLQ